MTASYDGSYLIFAGGHVYGLDGRQPKSYPARNDTAFLYECFYWEGVPARSVMRMMDGVAESLWFGTADGRICRFKRVYFLLRFLRCFQSRQRVKQRGFPRAADA